MSGGQEHYPQAAGGDLLGGGGDLAAPAADAGGLYAPPKAMVCPAQQGQGLQVMAALVQKGGNVVLEMDINNQSAQPVQNLAIQLNKSSFGLAPQQPAVAIPTAIMPGTTGTATVAMTVTPGMVAPGPPNTVVAIAIKNMHTNAVFYFNVNYSLHVLFKPAGLDAATFQARWGQVDPATTATSTVTDLAIPATADAVTAKLASFGLASTVTVPPGPDGVSRSYFAASTLTNVVALLEIAFKAGFNGVKVSVRASQPQCAEVIKATVETALRTA